MQKQVEEAKKPKLEMGDLLIGTKDGESLAFVAWPSVVGDALDAFYANEGNLELRRIVPNTYNGKAYPYFLRSPRRYYEDSGWVFSEPVMFGSDKLKVVPSKIKVS